MNAFGGVYGPFFTPENGLVNPPAHMVIDVEPVVEGPVFCQYRMRGTVPDGLRPELQDKSLEIWWSFYHRSHWFVRSYFVDDYETTIDGRPCRNRMTVGDEIESGKGKLLLSTYKHYQGTRYRAGRPVSQAAPGPHSRPAAARAGGRARRDGEARDRSGRGPGELALGQLLAAVLRHRGSAAA